MYLSDLIRETVNQKLQETCIGKKISFHPEGNYNNLTTIICKSVEFNDDDGDCWIEFIDNDDNKYNVFGQGLDMWFEIEWENETN
jgi:hypothetical protein